MSLTPDQLLAALRWRYATKQFDPNRSIPADTWAALEASLVLTPSSFGLQPWKFIVVENPDLRAKLREKSWNQPQVTDASHLVVFAVKTDLTPADIERWIERKATVEGKSPADLAPLKGMMDGFTSHMTADDRREWNTRQTYIAIGQFMAAAAVTGIDTCPLEGISASDYDHLLGLEDSGYATVVACAAGYRDPSDKYASTPKARYEACHLIERR